MNTLNKLIAVTFVMLMVFVPKNVSADDALYAKLPPSDASFFRFVNTTNQTLTILKDDKDIAKVLPFKASRYGFVPASTAEFTINDIPFTHDAIAERQVTIVVTSDQEEPFVVLEESKFSNKRKARIKLYNLSSMALTSLKTSDGKHLVIKPVETMQFGYRDVNSVKMKFAAFEEASKLAETETLTLKKDVVTSLFAFSSNDKVSLIAIESKM